MLRRPLPAAGCTSTQVAPLRRTPGDNAHLASPLAGTQSTIPTWGCPSREVPSQKGSTFTATLTRQLLPLHPNHPSPRRLRVSRGQVRTLGPGDSHPSSPIPLPSALNSRFQRSDTSPSLNILNNRVQWRRRFLCPHAWYPCPRPAKHHAPSSLRFPANLQAPLGDLSPRHPPNPRLQLPVPWSAGRSPAARLVVARRRGPAAGRGQRTARGARLANLRRRSPRYVYLGRLTPALPAGSGRALARAPVGRPGWFGA